MDLRLHSNLARLERSHRLHVQCILATTATQPSQTVIYNSEGNGALHTPTSPLRARTVPFPGEKAPFLPSRRMVPSVAYSQILLHHGIIHRAHGPLVG